MNHKHQNEHQEKQQKTQENFDGGFMQVDRTWKKNDDLVQFRAFFAFYPLLILIMGVLLINQNPTQILMGGMQFKISDDDCFSIKKDIKVKRKNKEILEYFISL